MSVMPKADINDIPFANKARCVGGMTAVPKTTDYDTIAERFDQPAHWYFRRIIQFTIKSAFSSPCI